MCGLVGFLGGRLPSVDRLSIASDMALRIAHRGPDDAGEWSDPQTGYTIAFRRLAILDLSPAGHQPMASASGRFVLAFNGEVYNFEQIRRELQEGGLAPAFRGHSDTEVMLAAFDAWGVESAIRRFIGMFAIALWDRQERRLHLVRDRVGVKPLYLARQGNLVVFGSELKAVRAHPELRLEIDRNALAAYFRFSYIPAPLTIYRDVEKVMPGQIISVAQDGTVERTTYWAMSEVASRGAANRFTGSEEEAADQLDNLLRDAVGLRMIADVPLGVFLSGGIDSSIVTALMQVQASSPVKTFSIGFEDQTYNEASHAAAVAAHLGTAHTELIVTSDDALKVVPHLSTMYDEPFADSSQIPTHLVSAMARRHVTVSLSGDGGDELFGGYYRHFLGQRAWKMLAPFPSLLRASAAKLITSVSKSRWDAIFAGGRRMLPRALQQNRAGERLYKLARILGTTDENAMYFELISHWRGVVKSGTESALPMFARETWPRLIDPIERMMYFDTICYLPDDILAKVDRASMSVSLEAREPLLDHRLIEFAWTLPLSMKVRDGKGKWLLRQVLDRYVPSHLIERAKMGFGAPVGTWIRGPLRDWAASLLDERKLQEQGFLEPASITKTWRDHLAGKGDWQHYLWIVLMFQSWLEEHTVEHPVREVAAGIPS